MASVMLFVLLSLAFSGAFTLWSEPEPGMCEWSMAGWNRVEASLEGVSREWETGAAGGGGYVHCCTVINVYRVNRMLPV